MMKRDNAVNVKMNEHELKILDALASNYSMSRSETIRYLIRDRYDTVRPEE